jgi:signal transduction histidine kinase
LAEATRQMVHRVTAGSSAQVDVQIDDLPPLPAAVEVAVYRITAEAVANAVRHADAGHITSAINVAPTSVTVDVVDDGSGLAEELRGSLRVESSPAGTKNTAELPRPAVAADTVERRPLPAGTA